VSRNPDVWAASVDRPPEVKIQIPPMEALTEGLPRIGLLGRPPSKGVRGRESPARACGSRGGAFRPGEGAPPGNERSA